MDPLTDSTRARRVVTVTLRLVVSILISIYLAFPDIKKFSTRIPGNPGDAYLVLALLKWGAERSTSMYSGYWHGPMFAGGHDAMAYTDTFLPLTVPFRLISGVTGSSIVAFNVLYLASWVLCIECTYLLLLHITRCRSVSWIGAVAFTFSTIRLAQTDHYQLMFAFFIPLALLIVLRLFGDARATITKGVLLGVVLAAQFLTSAYYGLILILCVFCIALVGLCMRRSDDRRRQIVTTLAASAAATTILVFPVAIRYRSLQAAAGGRHEYPATFALQLGDLRAAAPLTDHLARFSFLVNNSGTRSGENYVWVGFFVTVFVPLALIGMLASSRFRSVFLLRWKELAALLGTGLLAFSIAIGRGPLLGIRSPFYDIARAIVPGVESMVAIERLFVFSQLALTLVAALALLSLFLVARVNRTWRLVTTAVFAAMILVESSRGIPLTRVPTVAKTSVFAHLAHLPSGGILTELPMPPRGLGSAYAFIEATRMVLNSDSGQRAVNGYSGFAPPAYDAQVDSINRFPNPGSVATLRSLHVRYVVIHTVGLNTGLDSLTDVLNATGYTYDTPEHVAQILATLPPGLVERQIDASDGIILVLAD